MTVFGSIFLLCMLLACAYGVEMIARWREERDRKRCESQRQAMRAAVVKSSIDLVR